MLFTSADELPGWPLRFWCVMADTGVDGRGLLVRPDTTLACDGWTVPELPNVVHARPVAKQARFAAGSTAAAIAYLECALTVYANLPAASPPAGERHVRVERRHRAPHLGSHLVRCFTASRTSGRRTSSVEGRPTGTGMSDGVTSAAGKSSGVSPNSKPIWSISPSRCVINPGICD